MIDILSHIVPRFRRPELICSPQIPAPMSEVNPRTILGQTWWDEKRKAAYAENNQHCWACGVLGKSAPHRSYLEAHESYSIDYLRGRMRLLEVVALCHACHNFIHMGRLNGLLDRGECSLQYAQSIVNHGYAVLRAAGLEPWWTTRMLIEPDYAPTGLEPGFIVGVEWKDWRMAISGREHKPKYASREEHKAHFDKLRGRR